MNALGGGLLHRRRRRPEINIVPLMDISVKLIFFFLVSMQFRESEALNLDLPSSTTAGTTEIQGMVVIAIDRAGTIAVGGAPVADSELVRRLAELTGGDPGASILIRSDRDTPLQRVLDAMDACRAQGLNRITLQTQ